MRSKITIDFDETNQPIIKIDYFASEDVRDKMVKRFLEGLGKASNWCEVKFVNEGVESYDNSTATLTPIPPLQMLAHANKMKERFCQTFPDTPQKA